MTYLVDTDVLIDYLRNIEDAANYLDSIGEWTYYVIRPGLDRRRSCDGCRGASAGERFRSGIPSL
jgi:hypothetical protein